MTKERLRIAVQSKGRLATGSVSLLERAGFEIRNGGRDELLQRVKNLPIDILRVRDDDIASFVAEGVCDFGFVGQNSLAESGLDESDNFASITPLGFARCSLKIAVPEAIDYAGASSLSGKRIATSHPRLLRRFLCAKNVDAAVAEMHGSVEVAPRLQIASAVCDLVSTGATLEANGLRAVETVFDSEAVLIQSASPISEELAGIVDLLKRRIDSVVATTGTKYIMLNAPRDAAPEIQKLLPGAEAPTIMPLSGRDAVAIHAVCQESVFWKTLEDLKAAGASAILVLPIEKMML
ncbi:MAG: ATP phosphoribosyltransferase [Marinicaulis sp.]|nr:ATP phosphoribosyltransferase [Marinicaulis sp.]NNL88673.1 ATP phosphoribosyltransferase [Marinicaulis sp.]